MTKHSDLMSAGQLRSLVDDGSCRVVDCRFDLFDADKGRSDYREGHIPGAVYAHLDDDLASEITESSGRHPLPDPAAFAATLRRWGVDDDTLLVAYDHGNGALAVRFWWMLRYWLQHENVAVLDGGIAAWTEGGGALETEEPIYEAGSFTARPNDSVVVTVDEIVSAPSNDADFLLVDARDAVRYRGEREPIDPVAGHIPGARNLPLTVNVDDGGRWRRPDELRGMWDEFLADAPGKPVVAMCGSGVTACHLVLSAVVAGLPAPRVYVGSWSEWIRDPGRQIVVEN